MENVSIHAAALKAIGWFNLDPEAMSAGADKEDAGKAAESNTAMAPKPAPKKAAVAPEKNTPNTPLKFRLDKLERNHPYLAERGLSLETIVDFGVGFCGKGMMVAELPRKRWTLTSRDIDQALHILQEQEAVAGGAT